MMSPESTGTAQAGEGSALAAYIALGVGVVASAAVCVLAWLYSLPLGVADQWEWPLRIPALSPSLPALAGLVLLVAAAFYIVFLLNTPTRRADQVTIGVLMCCFVAATLTGGLFLSEETPLLRTATTTASIAALPYYGEALQVETLSQLFDRYGHTGRDHSTRPDRLRTHPPGPVVYYMFAGRTIRDCPVLMGLGERLFRNEGVDPELAPELTRYYSGAELSGRDVVAGTLASLFLSLMAVFVPAASFLLAWSVADIRTALSAALVSSCLPSLVMFVPTIDAAGTALAILALAAFFWARRLNNPSLAAMSGLLWPLAAFWSIGLLVVALPAALMVVWDLFDAERRRTAAISAVWALGVFGLFFAVLWIGWGYRPVANIAEIFASQEYIMSHAGRDRVVWMYMNIYEFALFMGPAVVALSVAGLGRVLYRSRGGLLQTLAAGLVGGFVYLALSGATRGEVGRIWLFLMPLFAVFAGIMPLQIPARHRWWYVPLIAAAQGAVCLVLYMFIIPVKA